MNKKKSRSIYIYPNQFAKMKEEFYLEGHKWLGWGHQFFFEWILEKYKCIADKPSLKIYVDGERVEIVLTPLEDVSNEYQLFLIMKLS